MKLRPIAFTLAAAVLLILYLTLFPFDFRFDRPQPFIWLNWRQAAADVPRNLLLFVPFGLALAAIRRHSTLLLPLCAGVLLSAFVEMLQIYLPLREPTLLDIIANGLGTLGGALLWPALAPRLRLPPLRWSIWPALLLYLLYAAALLGLSLNSVRHAGLSGWQIDYPLLIHDEGKAGDAPNVLQRLRIKARPLAQDAATMLLVDRYIGDLDDFSSAERGSSLPIETLNRAIRASGGLTIDLAAQSGRQASPLRLISIADSSRARNLMLTAVGGDLSLRLRTPFSDAAGQRPELIVPDIFGTEGVQAVVITYNRGQVAVYSSDRPAAQLRMAPEYALLRRLQPFHDARLDLRPWLNATFGLLYDMLLLLPLSVIAAAYDGRRRRDQPGTTPLEPPYGLLLLGAVVVAPIVLYLFLLWLDVGVAISLRPIANIMLLSALFWLLSRSVDAA